MPDRKCSILTRSIFNEEKKNYFPFEMYFNFIDETSGDKVICKEILAKFENLLTPFVKNKKRLRNF